MPRWHPVHSATTSARRLDGRPGAGLHAQGRADLRRGGRARADVDACRACRSSSTSIDFFEEIANRAARRIWAREPARRSARRTRAQAHALPHADRRRVAHRPAAAEQHRAHGDRGAGRRARRHAVAAHQLLRRGACAADRGCATRCARSRSSPTRRGDEHHRPARRVVLRRGATDELERQAYDYFAKIDELGGMASRSSRTTPSARSPTPPMSCRPIDAAGASSASTSTTSPTSAS